MRLTVIKGVSDKRSEELNKNGIFTAEDLVKRFPRSYLDLRKVTPIKYSYHNENVLTVARVVSVPKTFTTAKKMRYVKAVCRQGDDVFTAVWFNQPYVLDKLKEDGEYFFFGRVKNSFASTSLINPSFEPIEKNSKLKGIIPVYSIKGNIYQSAMRSIITNAIGVAEINSEIPVRLQEKYKLLPLRKAYSGVHNPETFEDVKLSSERIAIEEYFALISAFKIIKGESTEDRVNKYTCMPFEIAEFTRRFGFEFTDGQKRAVNEIYADLKSNAVMNRLLQGDVGSGKTAVSLTSMFVALKSGYQCAFLAPTEVLAEQNYSLVKKYLPEYECGFLSGLLTAKQKNEIKSRIKSGEIKVVVGTHAIIQGSVEFKNLSLCVCDEQHRFGVSQRSALLSKGVKPDLLVMSATPIPRTLSLVFYGDLDISTITDKPKARAEIKTHVVPMRKYEDMLEFIRKTILSGRQAYFVCPKIEGDDEGTLISVKELYEELSTTMLGVRFGLLHGKMKDREKNDVMQAFKEKQLDAIVSTTVIEVGIDVPNATIMVIYNAERFGLSQLHQLRGRVGRSDLLSYCFLLSDSDGEKAEERLKILSENSDGFKIAEYDYSERGGGDFMGMRQSGKFITDLGGLQYPVSAIFTAKRIADDAFSMGENIDELKKFAIEKYERLKDVSMN